MLLKLGNPKYPSSDPKHMIDLQARFLEECLNTTQAIVFALWDDNKLQAGLIGLRYKDTLYLSIVFMIVGAVFVQAAALVASPVMSFFAVNENPILDFLLFRVKEFTNYSLTIYPKAIQFLLTYILPFAFINFYPVSFLLGKEVPEGFPAVLPYLTPVVGAICFALSVLLWNRGLRHYKSTES